jgi:dimethylhistidine N-methyltransferase
MTSRFLDDAVAGLTATPKRLPPKYFYDRRGSALFERICELDEYYLTRTELAIMREHAPAMADALGPGILLIEPGSGASVKVRLLIDHLRDVAAYVPVEISGKHLEQVTQQLRRDLPDLAVRPVHADFLRAFDLPDMPDAERRVIYFPGSTIGNLSPQEAKAWLTRMGAIVGPGGGLLIGVDLKKDTAILEAAYNDREGVTRDFNLNLLVRLRDELGADVRVDRFEHRAFYNESEGRIEMHLVSMERQTIRLDHTEVHFEPGETIHTENSYKFDLEQFRALAESAGWRRAAYWTDENEYFSVQYCAQ